MPQKVLKRFPNSCVPEFLIVSALKNQSQQQNSLERIIDKLPFKLKELDKKQLLNFFPAAKFYFQLKKLSYEWIINSSLSVLLHLYPVVTALH